MAKFVQKFNRKNVHQSNIHFYVHFCNFSNLDNSFTKNITDHIYNTDDTGPVHIVTCLNLEGLTVKQLPIIHHWLKMVNDQKVDIIKMKYIL